MIDKTTIKDLCRKMAGTFKEIYDFGLLYDSGSHHVGRVDSSWR